MNETTRKLLDESANEAIGLLREIFKGNHFCGHDEVLFRIRAAKAILDASVQAGDVMQDHEWRGDEDLASK